MCISVTNRAKSISSAGKEQKNVLEDFRTHNGSRQGHNLASTVLFVPNSQQKAEVLHQGHELHQVHPCWNPSLQRANLAHIRQPRPDSGLGASHVLGRGLQNIFKKVFKILKKGLENIKESLKHELVVQQNAEIARHGHKPKQVHLPCRTRREQLHRCTRLLPEKWFKPRQ